jgi:hypothetical protein
VLRVRISSSHPGRLSILSHIFDRHPALENQNMQQYGRNDEILLLPYQVDNFLEQEEQLAELSAQVSMQLTIQRGRGVGPFHDNTLASAWYRMHPEELDDNNHSSDEVGGQHPFYFFLFNR